jgi:hypothetical protein
MGKWVVRSFATRFSVTVTVIIAERKMKGLFLAGNPGAEDSSNNGTALTVKVGS